jgi:glucosyl-3-phosphoglycerate synthase
MLQKVVFAVVGHNEQEYLPGTLSGVRESLAAKSDQLVFIDSGSTDQSRALARAAGVEVLEGPKGKGAAMRLGWEELRGRGEWIIFVDSDMGYRQGARISARLRQAVQRQSEGMVIGQFSGPQSARNSTQEIYRPLIKKFFPELGAAFGSKPLSGFRALHTDLQFSFPDDFGVESYINIELGMAGQSVQVVDLGPFVQPFRHKQHMPLEIATTILNAAVDYQRLSADDFHHWHSVARSWAGPIIEYRPESNIVASYGRQIKAPAL